MRLYLKTFKPSEKKQLKRFYEQVKITQNENEFEVRLDGRPVKTPLKAILRLPSKALAQQIADEWSIIETEINPSQMPMFSFAVTAIDSVFPQLSVLSSEMQNYIMNDLLCCMFEICFMFVMACQPFGQSAKANLKLNNINNN